jgi:hypothetical protein
MLFIIYGLSGLSILISISSLLIATYASKFEGGAGFASTFVFMIGAVLSAIVTIILFKKWSVLAFMPKVIGCIGTLPVLTVLVVLIWVLLFGDSW